MFAVREDGKLVEIFGEPWRGFRDVDKSILNQAGLRVHAHCLLAGRLAPRDTMAAIRDQVLDQLCSRGLVLDQHDSRTKKPLLLENRTFELGIFEASAE